MKKANDILLLAAWIGGLINGGDAVMALLHGQLWRALLHATLVLGCAIVVNACLQRRAWFRGPNKVEIKRGEVYIPCDLICLGKNGKTMQWQVVNRVMRAGDRLFVTGMPRDTGLVGDYDDTGDYFPWHAE